jgi:hypothetical protein
MHQIRKVIYSAKFKYLFFTPHFARESGDDHSSIAVPPQSVAIKPELRVVHEQWISAMLGV